MSQWVGLLYRRSQQGEALKLNEWICRLKYPFVIPRYMEDLQHLAPISLQSPRNFRFEDGAMPAGSLVDRDGGSQAVFAGFARADDGQTPTILGISVVHLY